MGSVSSFVKDGTHGATIDWVVLGAGVLLLGIMVVYDVYMGATYSLASGYDPAADAPEVSMETGGKRTPS